MSGKEQRRRLQERFGQHYGQMSKAERDKAAQKMAGTDAAKIPTRKEERAGNESPRRKG